MAAIVAGYTQPMILALVAHAEVIQRGSTVAYTTTIVHAEYCRCSKPPHTICAILIKSKIH